VILKVKPIIDHSVRGLCRKPYYNHPKGCPNFNKRFDCPPNAPIWDIHIDPKHHVYAIFVKFDFAKHKGKMRALHPEWSEKQVECCLYWQGTARKYLKKELVAFHKKHPGYESFITPEAMGINIIQTMINVGVSIDYPPDKFVYKIALAGVLLKK